MAGLTEYARAAAFCERGEYELAQKTFSSVFEISGRISGGLRAEAKAELAYLLGWTDLMLGRLDSAATRLAEVEAGLADLSRSLDAAAPDASKGNVQGTPLEYFRDLLKAEISLKEGKVDPDSVRAAFTDPPAYLPLLGDVIYMPRALNANFPVPLVKDTLGRAYVQNGELDKAIITYERLTTVYPKSKDPRLIHPLMHYRLAKLYDQTGQKDRARASYKKFLEFWKDADPGRPEIEDARNRLSRLG
jgi:tetratricopeptide (TPR) repeat protein